MTACHIAKEERASFYMGLWGPLLTGALPAGYSVPQRPYIPSSDVQLGSGASAATTELLPGLIDSPFPKAN